MIEKTTGDFNVEKLRIILLFKADFNANNKWIGRALMYQAEQNNLLAEEQYGSWKFKSAIHQCLNKCLLYDLIHFKRQLAALCSNDVKSCYDRITRLVAALCLCRFGCLFTAADCMITTIHEMNHHIHTTYGDSKISASCSSWWAPIAGIGQGNSVGPHIWAAVSSPMFDVMHSDGFYAHIITSILCMTKKLVGFAFVDDTDLCVFSPKINRHNVLQTMQQSVDNWEGLLRATGGALVPNKCFWYLLDFRFEHNRWVYMQPNQVPGEITICDGNHWRVEIPRLNPSKARRTLGVRLAPDGNWNTKADYLFSVAADWKVRMAVAKLNPTDAMFSLKNVVLRKLCYPLVTTTFS